MLSCAPAAGRVLSGEVCPVDSAIYTLVQLPALPAVLGHVSFLCLKSDKRGQ